HPKARWVALSGDRANAILVIEARGASEGTDEDACTRPAWPEAPAVSRHFRPCCCHVHTISTARPQVFHRAHSAARPEWQRGPSGAVSALDNARKAGEDRRVRGAAACLPVLLLAGVLSAQAQTAVSPLFRLFLTDGTEVVTYGEFTRLDDQ